MELRQLEHFVTVAEERHFTRAAELLQISQSGLSASIRALEHELGTALFLRSTRRVELTEAGRAMLESSIRTLSAAAAAQDAVAAVRGLVRGTLSLGVEQCLGVVDLPDLLATFRRRHPGVEIRLRNAGSTLLLDDVATGRLDLALLARCGEDPAGVTVTSLFTEPLVVLCHPDNPLAAADSVTFDDLGGQTFVAFQADWAARVLTQRAFAALGRDFRVELEVNDVHTLLDLIGHDLGVAVVPSHFSAKRPGQLRAVELRGPQPSWEVAVAASAQPSPATTAMLALLGEGVHSQA